MNLEFARPWKTNLEDVRGCEWFDSVSLILVHMSVEPVAQAFSELKQASVWHQDVYNRQISTASEGYIIFQLKGHTWSAIRAMAWKNYLKEKDAQALSALLNSRVIRFYTSDTSNSVEYNLYDQGKLVERFFYRHEEEYDEDEDENEDLEEEYEEYEIDEYLGPREFYSELRQVTEAQLQSPYDLIKAFFEEQDAYTPKIYTSERPNSQILLYYENLNTEDLVRMDYVGVNLNR